MRGTDDLVVLPALPVGILPGSILVGNDAKAVRETIHIFAKERETIEELAHPSFSGSTLWRGNAGVACATMLSGLLDRWLARGQAPFDVIEQATRAGVEPPRDGDAAGVENQESPERGIGLPRPADGSAVSLWNKERSVGCDRRGKSDDRRTFLVRLSGTRDRVRSRHQPVDFLTHYRGDHLEGGGVANAAYQEQ